MEWLHLNRKVLWALKIAIGCSMSVLIAELLKLDYSVAAGSIALLTIVSTKWGTVKLSLQRLFTFWISITLSFLCFEVIQSQWMALAVYTFLIVFICAVFNWQGTISVNVLIGLHVLSHHDFTLRFVYNEFMLVLIGVVLAFVLNLVHDNHNHKAILEQCMRYSEEQLQLILKAAASYLLYDQNGKNVWSDIDALKKKLDEFHLEAQEYQNNTFHSHPEYYIKYFKMRLAQCIILNNLHDNLKKLRSIPSQAKVIAEYMNYLAEYVIEINIPDKQWERLQQIFEDMKEEPLPVTREEFESRAQLYHVLMDLEDFLIVKKKFVEGMNPVQKKTYWEK